MIKPKVSRRTKTKGKAKVRPAVFTGNEIPITDDKEFNKGLAELQACIEFAKIRANRKQWSAKYGKKFDDWYDKVKEVDFIKASQADLKKYIQGLRKFKNLKRKPKQIVAPVDDSRKAEIDNLVNKLFESDAKDAGLTVEQYKVKIKKDAIARQKYNEEHWVSPLLDGQIFAILTQKETKPYYYMGKPVSKSNEQLIDRYKEGNKGWLEYKKKQNKNRTALEGIHIPPSIQKSQKDLQKIMEQIRSSVEPLRKATETIKKWNNPFNHLQSMGIPKHFLLGEFPEGLLSETRRIRKADNGLNSYAGRHELHNGIEVAEHYLKTHNKPTEVDYAVTEYENAGALADSVGMTPQELFKITADHIKLRKTEYKKRIVEMETGYLIEMLVNHYLAERERHEVKKLGALTMRKFHKSDYVQNFMKRTGLKYDYRRFDEQMRKWLKIYTSKAHKKN